jgi:hypothetical protein
MGEMNNADENYVVIREERPNLEELSLDGSTIFNCVSKCSVRS